MTPRLPINVIALGAVSLLMAISSQMIHGLLPLYLVSVLGASMIVVGLIDGVADAINSFTRVLAGAMSDRAGRRKPLVVAGYALAAASKPMFPLAGDTLVVLAARFMDRTGKGLRDAPRDALLADELPNGVRGAGYGLRLTLFTIGAMLGPLLATTIMLSSGGDMRLVFWIAVVPAVLSVAVLVIAVREHAPARRPALAPRVSLRALRALPTAFWWIVGVSSLVELARFSQAFLVLRAKEVGVDPAWLPMFVMLMSAVYGMTAYPFGARADSADRKHQLAAGVAVLISCHAALAIADTVWMTAVGAVLWGLQMGLVQGLIAASVADAAPEHLRGSAFGIYYLVDGVVSFAASATAGVIWAMAGSAATFGVAGAVASIALAAIALTPRSFGADTSTTIDRLPTR